MHRYAIHVLRRCWKRKGKVVLISFLGILAMMYYITVHEGGPYTGSTYNLHTQLYGETTVPDPTQSDINYIAENLQVRFSVVSNEGHFFLANYTFVNTGRRTILSKRWQLFFYSLQFIEQNWHPYPSGFYIYKCNMKVYHFNGNLFWFEPVGGYFKELKPGKSLVCLLKAMYSKIARSDSMPNWFVVGENLTPSVLKSTEGDALSFVQGFSHPKQYKDSSYDPSHTLSALERYKLYHAADSKDVDGDIKVLPTPLEMKIDTQNTIEWRPEQWVVVKSGDFPVTATYLAEQLKTKLVASKPVRSYIDFNMGAIDLGRHDITTDEAYTLTTDVENQRIHVTSATETGSFYAAQTLLSVLFQSRGSSYHRYPSFKVLDAPRYAYRGLHIDVARNFHGEKEIKKIMEAMAMYKMNKLHLHLSDDEGWRLEIPGMPELTQIGSKRCYDPDEGSCVMTMLGSGPFTNTSGSGYYDTTTYKRLLKHALKLHIEVIPEFDMPGHSHAAIASYLAKSRVNFENKYAIAEKNDQSDLTSGQFFRNNVINPCIETTYSFIDRLMEEVKHLHDEVKPLRMFHFGGDEVVDQAWEESKACSDLAKHNPELESHYGKMKYFIENLAKIASWRGLSIGSWEDGMISHETSSTGVPFYRNSFDNKNVYVYVWKRATEKSTPHRVRIMANYGYKVVLAHAPYFYFDHPYEADPEEWGLRWAAKKLPLEHVWDFTPNITEDDIGLKCPYNVKDKTDCFQLKRPENIIGIQAEVWTETIRSSDQLDYMLFPRLLAVAERAWHKADWEDADKETSRKIKTQEYAKFIRTIGQKELERLDLMDIRYRVPPPGARVEKNKVSFRTEFPNLGVEYFDEEKNTWTPVPQSIHIMQPLRIRTRSADGQRVSREVIVDPKEMTSSGSTGCLNSNIMKNIQRHVTALISVYLIIVHAICR